MEDRRSAKARRCAGGWAAGDVEKDRGEWHPALAVSLGDLKFRPGWLEGEDTCGLEQPSIPEPPSGDTVFPHYYSELIHMVKAGNPSHPLERTLQKTKTPQVTQHQKSRLNLVLGQRSPGLWPISASAETHQGTTPCTAPSSGHEVLAFPSLSPRDAATTNVCTDSRLPSPHGGRPRPA